MERGGGERRQSIPPERNRSSFASHDRASYTDQNRVGCPDFSICLPKGAKVPGARAPIRSGPLEREEKKRVNFKLPEIVIREPRPRMIVG